MNKGLPSQDQKTPPRPRRTGIVLWLMVTISCSLVLGTVLLSNDMQHLKRLSAYFDLPFFKDKPLAIRPQAPQTGRVHKSRAVAVTLPPHMLEEPRIQIAGAFINLWRVPAPELCQALADAGVTVSAFKASSYNEANFECSFEQIYRRENDVPVSSLFLVVRGNPDGALTNIRLKLVKPPMDENEQLDKPILDLIGTIMARLRSGACDTALDAVSRLRDVKTGCFGTGISFLQEIMHPGSFNLVLTPRVAPGAEARTKTYFDESGWLKYPDPAPATATDG